MKLFEKKPPREVKDDDPLFIKIWYNKRYHAIMSLSLYLIFFLIIIILVNVTSSNNIRNNTVNGTTVQKYFNALADKNVSYNYIINQGGRTYYFSGVNKNGGIFGSILYNGESTSINVANKECTVGAYDGEEFVPAYKLCPENIDYSYFDYNNLYELIQDKKGTINTSEKYYSFDLDKNKSIKIMYDEDVITKVVINDGNDEAYELNYSIDEEEVQNTTENNE